MKRFKLRRGLLVLPPCNGVTAEGKAMSGFAARVEADSAFAAANGYYPKAESAPFTPAEGVDYTEYYTLEQGYWVQHFVPIEQGVIIAAVKKNDIV